MYVCQDFNGNWFMASENLAAALDRESVRSPVNVPLALTVTVRKGFAQTCRNCCHTPGVTYEVEQHDELSPARAHYESDCKAPEGCYCAGARWES